MMKPDGLRSRLLAVIAVLVCIATCLSAFGSCAQTPDDPTGTTVNGADTGEDATEVITEGPRLSLDTPDMDFGKYTFNVMSIDHDSLYTVFDVGQTTGEPVNDAIFERNRLIESRYNVRFHCEKDTWNNTYSYLERQIQSNITDDSAYDLVMMICRNAYAAVLKNYLLNYNQLTYVDMDKDYYFGDVNEQFSIEGNYFLVYGADSINVLGQTNCIAYNKQIAADNQFGDLYEKVKGKTWTYDVMFEMAQNAASDRNGDGVLKYGDDLLGFIGDYDLTVPAAWVCAGEPLIAKDGDGLPYFSALGNKRYTDAMDVALAAFRGDCCAVFTANDGKTDSFSQNRAMFYNGCVCHLSYLKDMPSDYGVVPWPMFDESQGEYYSRMVDGWINCVPTTCQDPDRTGVILQALAYYSYKTVYDAYYDFALTSKYLRDAESVEMLKLILSTLTVDLGDTIWYEKLRAPLVDMIVAGNGNTKMSSALRTYKNVAGGLCRDASDYIKKLDAAG